MAEIRRVLVVDDHLEMLDFLRSVLELSSDNCFVLGVPSAEEGFSALRKTTFSLLIVDVQLPGIGGFNFVHQARKIRPEAPVILISADNKTENRKKAEALNVYRYYSKPLDSDALIYSVYKVLHELPSTEPRVPAPKAPTGRRKSRAGSQAVRDRLELLKTDTGAGQVILATSDGEVVVSTDKPRSLDLASIVTEVASTVMGGSKLVEHLGNEESSAIQYLRGEKQAIYTAIIDSYHWLALLFDVKKGRGKIGTIWFFSQKAISDLLSLMNMEEDIEEKEDLEESEPLEIAEAVPAVLPFELKQMSEKETDGDLAEIRVDPDEPGKTNGKPVPNSEPKTELDLYWDDALEEAADIETPSKGISFEEAQRLGLIPDGPDQSEDK
jgi:CheY-like chemotaxis protein